MNNSQKKILVIDDDPDIVICIQIMLEDAGYQVITADQADDIDYLLNELPDVIILDMLLSGKDGRQITKYLKSKEHTRYIPIIMISAHPNAGREAQAHGADQFIAKPFEMDHLLAKVACLV
jgi:DNA-binding response OmpR family regulator